MVKDFLIGIFSEEDKMLSAVTRCREEGFYIHDVYTPYAVHGLDRAMGLKPSRIPVLTFLAGFLAMGLAMGFQLWSTGINWPINVGGKPNDSMLAFLPVTFEVTVLIAGLTTAAVFFWRTRLFPGQKAVLIDDRVTDHVFVVVLEPRDASFNEKSARKIFEESGAMEIREKTVVS